MSTIKQKSAFVEIEGGKRIEVRRMRWKSSRDFLRELARLVTSIRPSAPTENGAWASAIFANIPEIIAGSDVLVTLLCTSSTGLSLEEFGELDALTALEVLRESLAINCDDEVKNSLAGIAGALSGLMPQPAPIKPQPAAETTT